VREGRWSDACFCVRIGLAARFVVEYERDFVSVSCDEEERGDGWEEGVGVVGR
jgi:hypothetical protein